MKILLLALFLVSLTWAVHLQFRKTIELKPENEYVWKIDNKEKVNITLGKDLDTEKDVLLLMILEHEEVAGERENFMLEHVIGSIAILDNEIVANYTLDYWEDNGNFAEKVGSLRTLIEGDELVFQGKSTQVEKGRLALSDYSGDFFS